MLQSGDQEKGTWERWAHLCRQVVLILLDPGRVWGLPEDISVSLSCTAGLTFSPAGASSRAPLESQEPRDRGVQQGVQVPRG